MKKYFYLIALLLLTAGTGTAQQQKKQLSLQDIWASATFYPEFPGVMRSMKDGKHYSGLSEVQDELTLGKYSYETGELTTVLAGEKNFILAGESEALAIDDYFFSPDESKVLLTVGTEPIYRHSFSADYYVYDFKTKKLTKLTEGTTKQSLATFSPVENKVAFVRENNVFIKDLDSGKETQVTTDGKWNHIINGAVDWVYEEEFSFNSGMAWSPDGKSLAYYRFDESNVPEFGMDMYQGNLYPEEYSFKYPKAGEANSIVTLFIHDLATNKNIPVEVGSETDQYIPRIKWTTDNRLSFIRMNRLQNKLELMFADRNTGKSKVILEEKNNTYIDVHDNLHYLKDGKYFLWTSELEGYNHIYLYDMNGKKVRKITDGEWEVTSFDGIDEKNGILYYHSNEAHPLQQHLYSIKLKGSGKKKLSKQDGYNHAEFSEGFQFYTLTHSAANTVPTTVLYNSQGKAIKTLVENKRLKNNVVEYNLPKKEFFEFTTSEGVKLNGWMIKPNDFSADKQYPAFLTIYGGPGHNTVKDEWEGHNQLWHSLLAQQGYVVVSVDNRGTGLRGEEFKKSTYGDLGKLETMDQIETAKYLGGLPYIDANRIGVQGWSFGGYLSSLLITKGAEYFKMAIAVAPVTNWRFYDTIYTERFLKTPQENASGYDDNSPINHVSKLKGPYLLVHGSADDNVHMQNTMEMVNALVSRNKDFDMFIYPDKNHGIYGGYTRLHLFNKMTEFIKENL